MPKIKIGKSLKVRFAQGEPITAMEAGTHELTEAQSHHWYIQAAIKNGRVQLVSDNAEEETTATAATASKATSEETAGAVLAAEQAAHAATKAEVEELKAKVAALEAAAAATTTTQETATDTAEIDTAETATDDIETRLQAVFGKLGDGDYKADGTPLVKAVEALLGESVTADQVAAAWAAYKAQE